MPHAQTADDERARAIRSAQPGSEKTQKSLRTWVADLVAPRELENVLEELGVVLFAV
jgi:hypothetical protein